MPASPESWDPPHLPHTRSSFVSSGIWWWKDREIVEGERGREHQGFAPRPLISRASSLGTGIDGLDLSNVLVTSSHLAPPLNLLLCLTRRFETDGSSSSHSQLAAHTTGQAPSNPARTHLASQPLRFAHAHAHTSRWSCRVTTPRRVALQAWSM